MIYKTPNENSVIAAKMCLEGYRTDENILFFAAQRVAATCWAAQNRPYAMTIGNHVFFT